MNELTKTGWALITVLAIGALALSRRVLEAALGKYVLHLLKRERADFRTFVADDILEGRGKDIKRALHLAEKHEDEAMAIHESIARHGAELVAIRNHTQGLEKLPEALQALAKSFEGLTISFAKMEEREKMRDRWDGITERRESERRRGG